MRVKAHRVSSKPPLKTKSSSVPQDIRRDQTPKALHLNMLQRWRNQRPEDKGRQKSYSQNVLPLRGTERYCCLMLWKWQVQEKGDLSSTATLPAINASLQPKKGKGNCLSVEVWGRSQIYFTKSWSTFSTPMADFTDGKHENSSSVLVKSLAAWSSTFTKSPGKDTRFSVKKRNKDFSQVLFHCLCN